MDIAETYSTPSLENALFVNHHFIYLECEGSIYGNSMRKDSNDIQGKHLCFRSNTMAYIFKYKEDPNARIIL